VQVHVIEKNLLPAVAPGHDVVDGAGILKTELARHVGSLPKADVSATLK
jgi:hypothetical protein